MLSMGNFCISSVIYCEYICRSNDTNAESAGFEAAEGSGLYDYDYSDSEYYQYYLGQSGPTTAT